MRPLAVHDEVQSVIVSGDGGKTSTEVVVVWETKVVSETATEQSIKTTGEVLFQKSN